MGRKEVWKSVFIFLITYPPCGITGMPFYSCTVMNECMCVCGEIKQGQCFYFIIHNTKKCVGVDLSPFVRVCQSVSTFVCVCVFWSYPGDSEGHVEVLPSLQPEAPGGRA